MLSGSNSARMWYLHLLTIEWFTGQQVAEWKGKNLTCIYSYPLVWTFTWCMEDHSYPVTDDRILCNLWLNLFLKSGYTYPKRSLKSLWLSFKTAPNPTVSYGLRSTVVYLDWYFSWDIFDGLFPIHISIFIVTYLLLSPFAFIRISFACISVHFQPHVSSVKTGKYFC